MSSRTASKLHISTPENPRWMSLQKRGHLKLLLVTIKEIIAPAADPFRTLFPVIAIALYIVCLSFNAVWLDITPVQDLIRKSVTLLYIDALMCGYGLSKGGMALFGIVPILISGGLPALRNGQRTLGTYLRIVAFLIVAGIALPLMGVQPLYGSVLWPWISIPIVLFALPVLVCFIVERAFIMFKLFLAFEVALLICLVFSQGITYTVMATITILYVGCMLTFSVNAILVRYWKINLLQVHVILASFMIIREMIQELDSGLLQLLLFITMGASVLFFVRQFSKRVTFAAYHLDLVGARATNLAVPIPYVWLCISLTALSTCVGLALYAVWNLAFQASLSPLMLAHPWDVIWPTAAFAVIALLAITPDVPRLAIKFVIVHRLVHRLHRSDYAIATESPLYSEVEHLTHQCMRRARSALLHVLALFIFFWVIGVACRWLFGITTIWHLGLGFCVLVLTILSSLIARGCIELRRTIEFENELGAWTSPKSLELGRPGMPGLDRELTEEYKALIDRLNQLGRLDWIRLLKQLHWACHCLMLGEKETSLSWWQVLLGLFLNAIQSFAVTTIAFGIARYILPGLTDHLWLMWMSFGILFLWSSRLFLIPARLNGRRTSGPDMFTLVTDGLRPIIDENHTGFFDVFISYNRMDKEAVMTIVADLEAQGYRPWIDEKELRPGHPWQRTLEEQIRNIPAAAVFVGTSGMGPWQDLEQAALMRQFAKRRNPVIPVILPGCETPPDLPAFLEGMTWVDFRKRSPEPLTQLIWGITGKKPPDGDFPGSPI